jgi:recombination protein RecA
VISKDTLAIVAKVNKTLGEGAVVLASDMHVAKRFPSGSLSLDLALGGGWPGNQWVEVIGKESHGKTAVVLKTISANQALNPDFTTLWIAAEHYDSDQARALGVDNTRVIVHSTQTMEEAYTVMLDFASSRAIDCTVLDSYPALIPSEEAEKDMDESTMALGARLTGKFFRKAGQATRRSLVEDDRPHLGIIINQYRDAIGQFSPHGTPNTTPGGKAKNYAFYTRVEVKRDEWIQEARPGKGKINVGQVIKVKTIKNKSAAPQQTASIDLYFRDAPVLGFRRGDIDVVKELVTMGILLDVIQRKGPWFNFGERKWQGKDPLMAELRQDADLREEVDKAVRIAAEHVDEAYSISDDDMALAETSGERRVRRR